MATDTGPPKDRWTSHAYTNAAAYVPVLTATVMRYLDPQSSDRILDIGCGDGVLSAKIAASCASLVGLDASAPMIKTATDVVTAKHKNATFTVVDCRRLPLIDDESGVTSDRGPGVKRCSFDKVFSNAAMHWILRHMDDRTGFFEDVYAALKPGGSFVFEMGGHHNVAEVQSVLFAVLHFRYGIPMERIKATNPWFFPSENWMRPVLETVGFEIDKLEIEFRPTACTRRSENGEGGLEGWLKLMASVFLDLIEDETERATAVKDVCSVLEQAETRVEDGSQWMSYVRLRGVARKPSK